MAKKRVNSSLLLILILIVVPIVVMAIMGFDHWDANEGLIISLAALADIAVFGVYKFLLHRSPRL